MHAEVHMASAPVALMLAWWGVGVEHVWMHEAVEV